LSEPSPLSPDLSPVFVLAAPGLPVQTLAASLGRHPDAFYLPETNLSLFDRMDQYQRELTGLRGAQAHGLLRGLAQLLAGEQSLAAVEMARRWIMRRGYMTTAMVAGEIAARVAPWRLVTPVVSTIFDPGALRRLATAFPQAAWVHLQAHPHSYGSMISGQLAGEVALALSGAVDPEADPPIPDPQDLWLMVEEALAPLLTAQPESRVFAVRLEALLDDPQGTLGRLAGDLGLPRAGETAIRAAMADPGGSPFAGPGPMGAPLAGAIGNWVALAAERPALAPDLAAPLPWRPDGVVARAAVRARAVAMGYA
jgi:hypothetical protein